MSNVKLFPHQMAALDRVKGFKNVAFFHEMGLGKTFSTSEHIDRLNSQCVLLVCPTSMCSMWMKHYTTHYPHRKVFDLSKPKQLQTFFEYDELKIGVVSYQTLWRRKDLLTLQNFVLVCDESSNLQHGTSKQTKGILKMNPSNVVLLSGTPCSGTYQNLWTQLHLLGWDISEDLYNKHYVNWKTIESDGFFHKVVDKDDPYKNVERLKQKLREHGADFIKTEEVFDLPEQTFTTVHIPSTKEYRKFAKDGYVQLSDGTEIIGDQAFTKRLYSRQLCGMYNQAKLDAFKDLLESTNDRVIVFYNFNDELRLLKDICDSLDRPYSQINGFVKDLTAYETKSDSVTLCQFQAASKGHNLQMANKIIYFTPTERVDDWMQSQKRIHRIGQTKPCFYYTLTCTNSVEEKIYNALQRGVDFTDDLFVMEDI